MPIHVTLQYAEDLEVPEIYPQETQFVRWADAIADCNGAVGVRIVGNPESARLNQQYRKKDGATNVLSFPFDKHPQTNIENYLGDIVMAGPLIIEQAEEQKKSLTQHSAHLFIHGILHLRGYDHNNDENADEMETYEVKIMKQLGFPNPYDICN